MTDILDRNFSNIMNNMKYGNYESIFNFINTNNSQELQTICEKEKNGESIVSLAIESNNADLIKKLIKSGIPFQMFFDNIKGKENEAEMLANIIKYAEYQFSIDYDLIKDGYSYVINRAIELKNSNLISQLGTFNLIKKKIIDKAIENNNVEDLVFFIEELHIINSSIFDNKKESIIKILEANIFNENINQSTKSEIVNILVNNFDKIKYLFNKKGINRVALFKKISLYGNYRAIEKLMNIINIKNSNNHNILKNVLRKDDYQCYDKFKLLVKKGIKLDEQFASIDKSIREELLINAAAENNLSLVKNLLKYGKFDLINNKELSSELFCGAIIFKNYDLAINLMKYGADRTTFLNGIENESTKKRANSFFEGANAIERERGGKRKTKRHNAAKRERQNAMQQLKVLKDTTGEFRQMKPVEQGK